MPFCTACGAKNPDDARFCNACGAAMPTAAPAVTAAPLARIKPFDNPDELWKMFFCESMFSFANLSEVCDADVQVPVVLSFLHSFLWLSR